MVDVTLYRIGPTEDIPGPSAILKGACPSEQERKIVLDEQACGDI